MIREAMARPYWTDGDAVGHLVRQRNDVRGHANDLPGRERRRVAVRTPRNMVCLPYP